MRRRKWTHDMRVELFQQLRERFGPKASWGASIPHNRKDEYEEFKKEMAERFRDRAADPELSAGAVNNQINWAMQQSRTTDQSGFQNMVLNTAAALYAGFLTYNDLPGTAAMSRDEGDDV